MIIVINLYLTRRALTEYEESRVKTEEEEATTSHGIRVNFLMNDGNTTIPDDIDYKVFGLDDDDDDNGESDNKKDVDNDDNPWNREAADTTTDERPPEETMTDHLKALAKIEMSNDKGYLLISLTVSTTFFLKS